MPTLLTKSLAASAVAGLCLVAAPQAQALNSFTLNGAFGAVSLDPPNSPAPNTPPASIEATFIPFIPANFPNFFQLTGLNGDFSGLTLAAIQGPLTFTQEVGGAFARYSLQSFDITFTGAGSGITTLKVSGSTEPDGNFEHNSTAFNSTLTSDVLLEAFDNNGLAYTGSFSLMDSTSNDGMFSLTFTAVPEPLTLMGASAAIAFGAAFKRRRANKG